MQFTNFPEIENIDDYIIKYNCTIESFDFVAREISLSDEQNIQRLRTHFKEIGSIHGPYKGLDFSSQSQDIISRTYEEYKRFHKIAVALGCKKVVVHNMCQPANNDVGYERSLQFWRKFLLEHKGVKFCLENIVDKSPDFLMKLVDAIDSDDIGICLDVGHVNVEVGDQVIHFIKAYGKRLAHAHLHNNNGNEDSHNGLNNGTINMKSALMELKKYLLQDDWNLETSDLDASFSWLVENGFIVA